METKNQVQTSSKKKDIADVINAMGPQIAAVLPRHMKPERMLRVMLTSVRMNPKLAACTQQSLLACLMKCSQYGLEPDGRHAHLIPFKDECTLIFDYKGLVNLVRRSGEVKDIHCDAVYENDEFDFCHGTDKKLIHRQNLKSGSRGKIYAFYSYVKLANGEDSFEVIPLQDIVDIRDNSQGYKAFKAGYTKSNPWDSNFEEMGKKTAFRRHTKWLPLSFEIQEAVNADDDKQSDDDRRFAAAKPALVAGTTELLPGPIATPDFDPIPENEPFVSAQESTPTPRQETKQAGPVPHEELSIWLQEREFKEQELIDACVKTGLLDSPCALGDFPDAVVKRCLLAKLGLSAEIKKARGGK